MTKPFYILIFILGFIVVSNFSKKEQPIQTLEPQDSILAFGDSLTYGYNAEPSQSYPSILSQLSHHKVINAGIKGETSAQGLIRLPQLLEDEHIKLMILCFGGNDIMQRKSIISLKNNLKTMIELAKEKNIDVLLVSVPSFSLLGLSPLDIYEEVSEEENIPLLSGILADILEQPSLKSDQVHPNALGYKLMGEKIYKKLKEEEWLKN